MYLFVGARRHSDVAACLRQAEASGKIKLILKEFDIERSPDHDLTNVALWTEILETLDEGSWFIIVSPPCNTFSRARFQRRHPGPRPVRTKAWPRGFPWLSNANKQKVAEANFFVDKCIEACERAANSNGFFILEHPEDLGVVDDEHPGSIWQWPEILELIPKCNACCFAIHQCRFGAITPKPTRLLTNLQVSDSRCHMSLPKFDRSGFYKGPLPRKCGHRHSHTLIGKTGTRWNTSPSAAYPPQMCQFLANLILHAAASFGGGKEKSNHRGTKRGSTAPLPAAKALKSQAGQVHNSPHEVHLVQDSDEEETTQCDGTAATVETTGDGGSTVQADTTTGMSHVSGDSSGFAITGQFDDTTTGISQVSGESPGFDMRACLNAGAPIQVEWDGATRGFIDGFGLCSPTRWKPRQRGVHRTPAMVQLAADTFDILAECVDECIADVRKESFRLVTGKIQQSPFGEEALRKLREKWANLLRDPAEAKVADSGQPFYLRALAQWLGVYEDPDAHWLVDESDSFASGVYIGVDQPLPRSPQVFPEKDKHRKLDDTEFSPIADNIHRHRYLQ